MADSRVQVDPRSGRSTTNVGHQSANLHVVADL
jgi:hypothetical protein